MDSRIARERLPSVIKTDSITTSQGDFFSTHVPIKRLRLLNKKFEQVPTGGEVCTEEQIYKRIIKNPDGKHQFVAVYGQSGTGKSHLIRWFETRFIQDMPDNEVVLFIRRNDNTLKGTIRQLLDQPEVKQIANREIYERLVKASSTIDENKLKDLIYHNFIVELDNDDGSHEIDLGGVRRKRLKAFLNNEVVEKRMLSADGPIERIYSKVAENSMADRDTVAQFVADDFSVSVDFNDDICTAGADRHTQKMARLLMSDEDGPEEAQKLAAYMNQFVNDVIQRCSGIEPGDFRQMFLSIRRELCRLGKNLTLFIEDITSFTGVDDALIDALIVEHTGMNEDDQICRISSIVGSTSSYLQDYFRDNHKDRITSYIYIPSDAFDEEGLYEFVGRYLNTMSLPENVITAWMEDSANPEQYPVHEVKEGKTWDFVCDSYGKKLSLYPFTKKSIKYLYEYILPSGQKTPRYIIRDIIEVVVTDILNNKENFPSTNFKIINQNISLSNIIRSQISNQEQADRVFRFLSIWGDGSNTQYEDQGRTYISGIPTDILSELEMPTFTLAKSSAPKRSKATTHEEPAIQTKPQDHVKDTKVSMEKQEAVSNAISLLTEWANGKIIDISSTVGTSRLLNSARGDLNNYLYTAVNWQSEGVSIDNLNKIRNSRTPLLAFANQAKNTGYYILPNNWESLNVICAFIKWREYGNESWNYPNSDVDVFRVAAWTRKVIPDVVKAVDDRINETRYIEAAMKAGMFSAILNGEYRESSLDKFSVESLFAAPKQKMESNAHSNEWNGITAMMAQQNADQINRDTIRQYFNLVQGKSSSLVILNAPVLTSVFRKVKAEKLNVSQQELDINDPVKQRQEAFEYLKSIALRAGKAAEAEKAKAGQMIRPIYEYFDSDEIEEDDILDLVRQAGKFYDQVNAARIPISGRIPDDQMSQIKKNKVRIARSLTRAGAVLDQQDLIRVLLAFSSDPLSDIQPLAEFLEKLNKDLDEVSKHLEKDKSLPDGVKVDDSLKERYRQEKDWMNEDKTVLEDWRCSL